MSKKKNSLKRKSIHLGSYAEILIPHLERVLKKNQPVMNRIAKRLIKDITSGKSLFVFGSGHSSIFSFELYHRAGGPSFLIPMVADYLLPTAGPPVVRMFERSPESAVVLLNRHAIQRGEMLWIASQSGVNGAGVELALEAKRRGIFTVAFTSLKHSKSVQSRHASGKRLFEVCDEVVDLMGERGDAALEVAQGVKAGPLSSMGSIFLAHSTLSVTMAELEKKGIHCVYTSVNTPEGEARNKEIEKQAALRDPLLR